MMGKVGDKIRKIRSKKGLTQTELGKLIGVSAQAVSQWEREINNVDNSVILDLCKALEVSADELLGVENTPVNTLPIDSLVITDEEGIARRFYELDEHGKQIVRTVLKEEYRRVMELKNLSVTLYPVIDTSLYPAGQDKNLDYDSHDSGPTGVIKGDEIVHGKIKLAPSDVPDETDYIVYLSDDSMEPTFGMGDKLFVQRASSLAPGEIGVFYLDGLTVVRELVKEELIAHNDKYEPIKEIKNKLVVGKVIGKVND